MAFWKAISNYRSGITKIAVHISVYAFVFCVTDSIHSVIGDFNASEEHADCMVS